MNAALVPDSEAPLVSIIVPAYNREATIARAIDSIGRLPSSFEIIVVDDGSTDGTLAEAQAAVNRIAPTQGQIILQANAGPGAARNHAAERAQGRWLAFLDSDDVWMPWTVKTLLDLLPGSDCVDLIFIQNTDFPAGAPLQTVAQGAQHVDRHSSFVKAARSTTGIRFATCNAIVRRDMFTAIGGFSKTAHWAEDTDLFLRASSDDHGCHLIRQPIMMGHERGSDHQLTASFAGVLSGLDFQLAQERAGAYHGAAFSKKDRNAFLAQSVCHTILAAFAAGHIGKAYALYFEHFVLLWRARSFHWGIRFPVFPLLHFLRPRSFVMRWRPLPTTA